MSSIMQDFLSSIGGSSFVKSAPRPPVPGEETDNTADPGNGLGATHSYAVSTRSSAGSSHRSHTSSSKSGSGKNGHSGGGGSPAATPRKSNLDRTLTASSGADEAPLGFEPEGSVSGSPYFAETSCAGIPACLRWAENLRYLLEDGEGVKLYKLFLDQEIASSAALDFWFACSGLKLVRPADCLLVVSLVKLIYKKYVKSDVTDLRLMPDIKRRIVERLKKKQIDSTIYDEAQAEVENSMRNETYPLFLKSDIYLAYVQNGSGESPKTSNNSSGSDSNRPLLGLLPTVHEERELKTEDIRAIPPDPNISLTETVLISTQKTRNIPRPIERFVSVFRVPNPYHTSFAPVSTQDSELQSASSDAQTDDALSHTEDSGESRERRVYSTKTGWKKHRKTMQKYAPTNHQSDLSHLLIPRTERAPRDRSMAENEPEKFASILIERLQRLKDEEENLERIKQSMNNIELSSSDSKSLRSSRSTTSGARSNSAAFRSASSFPSDLQSFPSDLHSFPLELLSGSELDDSAQSILEEHVSRVWDNSFASSSCEQFDTVISAHRTDSTKAHSGYLVLPSPNTSALNASFYPSRGSVMSREARVGSAMSSSASTFDSGVVRDDGRLSSVGGSHFDVDCHPALQHQNHQTHYGNSFAAYRREQPRHQQQRQRHEEYLDDRQHQRSGHLRECATEIMLFPQLQSTPRMKGGHSHSVISRAESETWGGGMSSGGGECHRCGECRTCIRDDSRRGVGGSAITMGSVSSLQSHDGYVRSAVSQSNMRDPRQQHKIMTWIEDGAYSMARHASSSAPDDSHIPTSVQKYLYPDRTEFASEEHPPQRGMRHAGDSRLLPAPLPPAGPSHAGISSLQSVSSVAQHSPLDLSGIEHYYQQQHDTLNQRQHPLPPQPPPSRPQPQQTSSRLPNHQMGNSSSTEVTVVGYKFCDEEIPYRTTVSGRTVTLGQFKQLITKKGNFRYFFKKACDEFDSGVVHEEIFCDGDVLPLFEGKIFGKIEKRQ